MSLDLYKRKAFTLVELLVVIAIIGILIALLLPAVQAAREAARRAQCTNNAKQIALAMHNYHDSYKMFPINYGGNQQYNLNATGHSWMTGILPYVELQSLYDQIDFGLPLGDINNRNVNTTAAQTVVPAFLCPSDSNDEGLMSGLRNVTNTPWGITNYKACAGGNWAWGDNPTCRFRWPAARWPNDWNGLDRGNGIICRNSDNQRRNYARFAEITDGTSNTFAVGEAVPKWCTHTGWYWFNGCTATCGIPLNYEPNVVRSGARTMETNWDDWGNNYSFMSRHPGGGNFGLCDGSVTFVSDTIDITTYRHLANIADDVPVQVP